MDIQEALNLYETTGSGRIPEWADALSIGLQVTVIGLLIVFAVLIILMFVLIAMKYIFAPKEKSDENVEYKTTEPETKCPVKTENEEELIAVLTAAVAASLNTSTYNLKIKSFRRIGNTAPAWNKAGLNDTINSRF